MVSTVGPGVEPVGPEPPRAARTPARPPGTASRSSTVTRRPAPASRSAADSPASPAPTTTTWSVGPVTVRVRPGSHPASRAARLPAVVPAAITRPAPSPRTPAPPARHAPIGDVRRGQGGQGLVDQLVDQRLDGGQRAGVHDDLAQRVDAGRVQVRVAEQAARPAPPGPGVAALQSRGDQHRALALAQVVAGRLAGLRRVAEDAEHVVAQLERLAERQPVARSSAASSAAAAPASAPAEVQRLLDRVLRALVPDHATGPLQRALRPPAGHGLLEHVEVLPGHELGAHLVEDPLARGRGPPAARPLPVKQLVAPRPGTGRRQDRAGQAEPLAVAGPAAAPVQGGEAPVDRRRAAPGVGVVHDVVVDQGGGLEELQRGGRRDDRLAVGRRRRRASPSSRRPGAAACRPRSSSATYSTSGPQSGLTSSRTSRLARQEVVDDLVDADVADPRRPAARHRACAGPGRGVRRRRPWSGWGS